MKKELSLDSAAARELILAGHKEAISVDGLLDLRGVEIETISADVTCHDLDATGSSLSSLPQGIKIASRLILDDCSKLESLPENLECGSISLRNCNYLSRLPENLSTWFLDLTNCQRFSQWPQNGTIQRGILRLRNCVELQTLPGWLGLLGQLDLSGCVQVNRVPEGVRVSSWIDIGGTGIESLPASLQDTPLRWRSVPINKRIAFEPESIAASEVLEETNAEIRRVMIDRIGYLKFAEAAGAKRLDSDTDPGGKRELLQIELPGDEPLVGLACFCPSTGRQYFLRVPPTVKTCHQAAAWMAGFDDPKLYKPVLET